MMKIIIHHQHMLSMCVAMPFFLKEYASLIEAGHAKPHVTWSNESKCVYAMIESRVIGCIVYDYHKVTRAGWIILTAVDEEFRRRGVFKLMQLEFESRVRALGAIQVGSQVSIKNDVSIAAHASVGMLASSYKMYKALESLNVIEGDKGHPIPAHGGNDLM